MFVKKITSYYVPYPIFRALIRDNLRQLWLFLIKLGLEDGLRPINVTGAKRPPIRCPD